jgi:arabinan endo-1,5-alpha-L-arabinosidase
VKNSLFSVYFFLVLALLSAGGCMRPVSPLFTLSGGNPVVGVDTADPCIVVEDGVLYSYSTSGCERGGSLHIRRSTDGVVWEHIGFILHEGKKPAWIGGCDFWAPEVHKVGDQYVAYYSAHGHDGRFRIGAAMATHAAGPFVPHDVPVASNDEVGLIDSSFFRDPTSGRLYLLWKEDRNALQPQEPTPIMIAEVAGDGVTLLGPACEILRNDSPWEGNLVEASNLIYRKPFFYLFYSGNAFFDERYGIGVARARNVAGPYEKYAKNPITHSDERFDGPGHPFLIMRAPDVWTIFYHARERATESKARVLMANDLTWKADEWCAVVEGSEP